MYKDPERAVEERVHDLLQRMTLKEKVAQTLCVHVKPDMVDEEGRVRKRKLNTLLRHGIGQLGKHNQALGRSAEESAHIVNRLQTYVTEKSRLDIPAIIHEECLHGLWARGATIFPQSAGMASTWDPELVGRVFNAVALETRTRGGTQANTPMIDVCREPRFGRIEESYGEDPYLVSRFAVAAVRGLQGHGQDIDDEHLAATVKHFAAYGEPLGGLNKAPPPGGERQVREVYLPPFRAAITEAGALSVMPSYNEIDGVPSHANAWLLTDVLRGEWGFAGYVASDYGGIEELHSNHRIAATPSDAARRALLAGVDMELPDPHCFGALEELVQSGRVPMHVLDEAVKRILRVKFLLGLFENPFADPPKAKRVNRCTEHRALALDVAHKSIVLLKNRRNLLPLNRSRIKLNDPKRDAAMIQEAVDAAKKCDVAIVVVGETPLICGEFIGHRSSLELLGRQNELVRAVGATGTPMIVCLVNGRPLALNTVAETAAALLECWYLGEQTGVAVADVLFGDVNPSGKLPFSFPRSVGHVPAYYNARMPPDARYLLSDRKPLFPFGCGLSYTRFTYSNLCVTPRRIKRDAHAVVRVDVTNTGKRAGYDVVQLYVRDLFCSVTRPPKELKGFARVDLDPGEQRTVELPIGHHQLACYDRAMKETVEPGVFELMVGPDSVRLQSIRLTVD